MESISCILFSLYRDTPFRQDWLLSCLDGAWSGLFGGRIAAVCRPLSLRDGRLTVVVTGEHWRPALADMRAEMLRRISLMTAGEVAEVRFVGSPEE